jgi:predicted kinase
MDLDGRGYRQLARRFRNGYLQLTGDYAGLGVLRYYLVYRALVRAKVAALRRGQTAPGSTAGKRATDEYRHYAQLATEFLAPPAPTLLITCGLSGSGKSTIARQLCERTGMFQLRADVERKRLAGLAAGASSHSPAGGGLYTAAQTDRTYRHLEQLAARVLADGYSVVVDATFLQQARRERFRALAGARRVPFVILHCEAPDAELERRVRAREAAGGDPSEAGLDILRAQYRSREALLATELPYTLAVDTQALDLETLPDAIERLARRQAQRGPLPSP